MRLAVGCVALAACGSPPAATERADAPSGCVAELSGNFAESSASPASCPVRRAGAGASQGDTLLHVTLASAALGADFTIDLDLGPQPTPGTYSSETTGLWSAAGTKLVPPTGACLFLAGNNTTPSGYFVLDDGADAHGTLSLTMAVLPRAQDDGTETDCGAGTTERLELRF